MAKTKFGLFYFFLKKNGLSYNKFQSLYFNILNGL